MGLRNLPSIAIGVLVMTATQVALAPAFAAEQAPAKQVSWELRELFKSDNDWEKERQAVEREIGVLAQFRGKLGASAATLASALDLESALNKRAARLSVYASLKSDEDVRVAPNKARNQLSDTLASRLTEATSWARPELLAVGPTKIEAFIKAEPKLAKHAFALRDLLRNKPHTLGAEAEGVLAQASNVLGQPSNVYGVFADGDLEFPTVKLSDGKSQTLDQAAYSRLRQSPNRADRKLVFDTFWPSWKKYESTFGANLNSEVLGTVFQARARNFKSALDAQLFAANLPGAVYRSLITEVNRSLPTYHRYLKLRARMLGVKDLGYHDTYASLTQVANTFSVDESKRITLAALEPFGPEYLTALKAGFAGTWMHVYPQPGKHSGAYMNGSAYDVHPFVLLNHNDDYDSLSTFAHEWGHAVHSVLANKAQPWELAGYSTFTAETASITNEMLLQDYMLGLAKTRQEKLGYLNEALDSIRGTYFRQAMFAEFQLKIHELAEAGQALTGEKMTQVYCALLKRYHGHDKGVMKIDPAYCVEWAFIPHFYSGFYVFQYATSIAGSAYFADAIKREGEPARKRFIALLAAGGSDYSYGLYKKAGLDMATPVAYRQLDARMNRIMDDMERLLAK